MVMTGRPGDPGDEHRLAFDRCWRAVESKFPWRLPSELGVHDHAGEQEAGGS